MMSKKVGRPRKNKPIEEPKLTSYLQEITLFRNSLVDCLEEPDYQYKKDTIQKFLALPLYQLNIFIVYLIESVSITKLAELLCCDRIDVFRVIQKTKKELKRDDLS